MDPNLLPQISNYNKNCAVCELMSQYVFVCREDFNCFNCGRHFILPSKNRNTTRNSLKKKSNNQTSISTVKKQRKRKRKDNKKLIHNLESAIPIQDKMPEPIPEPLPEPIEIEHSMDEESNNEIEIIE